MLEENREAQTDENSDGVASMTSGSSETTKKRRKRRTSQSNEKTESTEATLYLLLTEDGKYIEVSEDGLTDALAQVVTDKTLRLMRTQQVIPKLSYEIAS